MARSFRRFGAASVVTLVVAGGCLRFTPFELDFSPAQTNLTQKNVEALAARPVPKGPIRFYFFSDTHHGLDNFQSLVDTINGSKDTSFAICGGDVTNFGSHQEYVWAYDHFSQLNVPFFSVVGNHDLLAEGRLMYEKMFGPISTVFFWGGIRFVLFNNNTLELDETSLDLDTLRTLLETPGEADRTIVVTHQHPDSRPDHAIADEAKFRELLESHNVILNLHGHLHPSFRMLREGPTAYVRTAAALVGNYLVVTLDGDKIGLSQCALDGGCKAPVDAATLAPWVDEE